MFNAFRKDVAREIKNTFSRFAAICAIVFLGVAFFAGLGATGIDMKLTGDLYFSEKNLMDLRVVSTYGINGNDIKAMRAVKGVEAVYPAYSADAFVTVGDTQVTVKAHSLDIKKETVNNLDLLYGRMPLEDDEAVVEEGFAEFFSIRPGDSFYLESGGKYDLRDSLRNVRFKLVGVVNSVYYISYAERGSASIGNGVVNFYMYIPETNFRSGVYSEAFVTVEGARAERCFEDRYKDMAAEVLDRLEALGEARIREKYIEATDLAFRELEAAEEDLKLSAAVAAGETGRMRDGLIAAKTSLEAARRGLSVRQAEVFGGLREIDSAGKSLRGGIESLNEAEKAAAGRLRELTGLISKLNGAIAGLERESAGLDEKEALAMAAYLDDPQAMAEFAGGLAAARAEIAEARESLAKDLGAAIAGEASAREAINGIAGSRAELEASLADLAAAGSGLAGSESELIYGFINISANINEIDRQLLQLEEQAAGAERAADESAARIRAARKALAGLDKPKWYVMDRESNPGYSGFFNDADKVDALGRVFPFIFYLVAALVSLTTMTRLIEEKRAEIGTLKALGYGGMKIMSKYAAYAALPTIAGGLAGGVAGMLLCPDMILTAYKSLYAMPRAVTPIHAGYLAIGMGIGVLSTLAATAAACYGELLATPMTLLRPKSPKKGAKIFLERVPVIWNSFSFTWKVTIRNILRYKKRFFMTVVGVTGCTALMLTGFGLRDSIESVVYLQFGEVNLYDITATFTDTAKQSDRDSVKAALRESDIVRGYMPLYLKTFETGKPGFSGGLNSAGLLVPSDSSSFFNFVSLRDRLTRKRLAISENQALITEKLAFLLGVGRGDEIYILNDGEHIGLTVSDVVENYYQHFIYIHENLYAELFGEKPEYNNVFVLLGEHSEKQKHDLANKLLEEKGVGSVFLTSTVYGAFQMVIDSLTFVVTVLIASAALLAAVVLFNLTNINISERKRELATIEVLGFYDREVSDYIYRENVIMTLIGAAAGLVFGVALHSYVIVNAESDIIMFGRRINDESFLYSFALTILFASLTNILTAGSLRKINMVEALKSVE